MKVRRTPGALQIIEASGRNKSAGIAPLPSNNN